MAKQDFDSLEQSFFTLMRGRDYASAVRFFIERVHEALQVGDEEATRHASHFLISSLITAGPDEEALSLLWQVVDSFPEDIYLRSSFASFLLFTLRQPAKALEMLDSVFDKLVAEGGSRHATLGLRGTILLALGREQEAEHCFREMLQPSLRRMHPSTLDLRLVGALISRGLMKEECEHYLKIVSQVAQEAGDQGVLARADEFLRKLRMT